MKREDDKRLIIPKDSFEEEASEGLGRLNKDEAAEDLRDLEKRMAQRLRKPIRVWIPAAAAVTIILIASTIYIGLFRERQPAASETAMVDNTKKDTILIAMAEPLNKVKAEVKVEVKAEGEAEVKAEVKAEDELIIDIIEKEAVAEVVIVQAMPERAKAAQGAPAGRAETRSAKNVAVADRETEYASIPADRAPLPVGGMEELNTWISNNIRYPADAVVRTRQQVILTFKVRVDSTVYDLKAERTPGDRFTEEAVRLLREGPHWAPAFLNGTPVEETVRLSLLFK